jgi:hypothetical protein
VDNLPVVHRLPTLSGLSPTGSTGSTNRVFISYFGSVPVLTKGSTSKAGKKIYWLPLSPSTVFKTHKEITAYQSLLSDPEISIEELDKVGQEKAFVQVANTLMDFAS